MAEICVAPTAECGNHIEEPGEICDDGDKIEGNGCNNDCRPSAEVLFVDHVPATDLQLYNGTPMRIQTHGDRIYVGVGGFGSAHQGYGLRVYNREGQFLELLMLERELEGGYIGAADDFRLTADGDIVFLGYFRSGDDQSPELVLQRQTPSGEVIWRTPFTFHASSSWGGSAKKLAVDQTDGSVYATGVVEVEGSDQRRLVKFDSSGRLQWNVESEGSGCASKDFPGVEVQSGGEVIALGETGCNPSNGVLRRHDQQGAVLWTSPLDDVTDHLYQSAEGHLAAAGFHWALSRYDDTDVVVIKAATDGSGILWRRAHDSGIEKDDLATAVGVLPGGDVVAGMLFENAEGSAEQYQCRIMRYAGEDGSTRWSLTDPGPETGTRRTVHGFGLGPDGRTILVAGTVETYVEVISDYRTGFFLMGLTP